MMSLLVKATLALGLFANAAVAGGYTNGNPQLCLSGSICSKLTL